MKCQTIVTMPVICFPRAQGAVFQCLVLSNQQLKTQRGYFNIWHRKAIHCHIWEAATSKYLAFLLKWTKPLFDYQNCCFLSINQSIHRCCSVLTVCIYCMYKGQMEGSQWSKLHHETFIDFRSDTKVEKLENGWLLHCKTNRAGAQKHFSKE